ncbi:MAG: hypothetical protein K8L91_20195 [Anaerolineae bacterium]|nr:hypothetical protein [Anaerolineae bacterium]
MYQIGLRQTFKTVIVVICLAAIMPQTLLAQGNPNEKYLIYNGGASLVNISWANDSLSLAYEEYRSLTGVCPTAVNTWHRYFVETLQTTDSDCWALQPTLTPEQQSTFEILVDADVASFVFISPTNRYIVYMGTSSVFNSFPLGIADLSTGQHRILEEIQIQGTAIQSFDLHRIQWDANGSAFTFENSFEGGDTEVYYISNLDDLNNLTVVTLGDVLLIGEARFGAHTAFDSSPVGQRVLLGGSSRSISPFVLWDVVNETGVPIEVDGRVAGAAFFGENHEFILFVDEAGLKRYEIQSSRITLLNPEINSIWGSGGVFFSPNAQRLALVNGGRGGGQWLYVIPIPESGLALFRTDTLQANLLQTLDTDPAAIDYYSYATGVPTGATGGQWVMGDWDGDGVETPGVYGPNGVFYHTNVLGPSSSWVGTWFGLLTGTAGNRPVAGRFDASINHDCIGVTDSADFPPYGTAFALYFTCDLAGGNPAKTFQWLSVLLPTSQGHSGIWEFSAGNYDPTVDAVDTIACRRGNFIAWTNTPPTTQNAAFPYAQYIGAPHSGTSQLVVGDWDSDGTDSFGLYYTALGRLRGRDDLDWNSGLYPLDQQLDTNVVGTTNVSATTWRLR